MAVRLMGAPEPAAREASALCWPRLLGYLGLLAMPSRSASVLCAVVSGYFGGVRVAVEEYVPRWVEIHSSQRCELGVRNTRLGESVSLGGQVRDHGGKFRVLLGPLDWSGFNRFLPDGEDYAAVVELVAFLMPEELLFDIELRPAVEQMPPLALAADQGGRLGWSSWLGAPGPQTQGVILSGVD